MTLRKDIKRCYFCFSLFLWMYVLPRYQEFKSAFKLWLFKWVFLVCMLCCVSVCDVLLMQFRVLLFYLNHVSWRLHEGCVNWKTVEAAIANHSCQPTTVGQFQESLLWTFVFQKPLHFTQSCMCPIQWLREKYTNFYIPWKGIHVNFFLDKYLYIKRFWKSSYMCLKPIFRKLCTFTR